MVVAAGPVRLRFESKFHAPRFQLLRQLVEISNIQGDMAIPGAHFFDVARAPGFDQFQPRIFILSAVTDIADTFLFLRVRSYTLDIHAKKAGVKIDASVEVAHEDHRVPNA